MLYFYSKKWVIRLKKYTILILCLLLLVTGCSATKKEAKKAPVKEEKVPVIKTTNESVENEVTDEDVVNYVSTIDTQIENISKEQSSNKNVKESLKENFIILTDFIFYNGTIKGKTFNDLSTEAKEKIIELYEKIDGKIESVYPGYKEEIKDTSTKVYSKVKEMTISLKETLKQNYIDMVGEDVYQKEMDIIKEKSSEVKEKASPVISSAKEKTKEVYENTKDKLNTWYQGIKESSE